MKPFIILLFSIVYSISYASLDNSIGIEIAQKYSLQSRILNERRDILVSLPENYVESGLNYPVLYLIDGSQNLKHVVGSAELLAQTGSIPPMIIVGIESIDRMRDLTISKVDKQSPISGGADKFMDFISEELMPYIEKNFRTHPYRILEGHSLGGLFTSYVLIEKPELFNAHIVISPSFWWNEQELKKKAKVFFKKSAELTNTVFFGIGNEDGFEMRQELSSFVNILKLNQPKSMGFAHREFESEGHMSATLLANYHGLKHVFSDIQFPRRLWENFDSKVFLSYLANIEKSYGVVARQTGETYASLGSHLTQKQDYQGAITVYKQNIEDYPNYAPNFAVLADAYEMNENPDLAIDAYKKAYEIALNSKSGGAESYLQKIELIKNPVVIKEELLNSYVGLYESAGYRFLITKHGDQLIGKMAGNPDFDLYPEAQNKFYLKIADVKFEFVEGKNKEVEKMIFTGNGRTIDIKKLQ